LGGRAVDLLPQCGRCPALPDCIARFALDQCAEAVLLADEDGRLAYANPAACALLGYASEEVLEWRAMRAKPC